MLVSTAVVATTRSDNYAEELVSHLGRQHDGDWSHEWRRGWVDFDYGYVDVQSTDTTLTMCLTAAEGDVARLEDVVARHLERCATRDNVAVRWTRTLGHL